jgi:hypothetical protein
VAAAAEKTFQQESGNFRFFFSFVNFRFLVTGYPVSGDRISGFLLPDFPVSGLLGAVFTKLHFLLNLLIG